MPVKDMGGRPGHALATARSGMRTKMTAKARVVLAYTMQGMTPGVIAEKLGVTASAVSTIMQSQVFQSELGWAEKLVVEKVADRVAEKRTTEPDDALQLLAENRVKALSGMIDAMKGSPSASLRYKASKDVWQESREILGDRGDGVTQAESSQIVMVVQALNQLNVTIEGANPTEDVAEYVISGAEDTIDAGS